MSVAHLSAEKVTHKAPMKERLSYYTRQFVNSIGDMRTSKIGLSLYTNNQDRLSDDETTLISFLNSLDDKMFGELCGR